MHVGRRRPAKPRLLLLQGPVGRFFGALARSAVAAGFDVTKVHFNSADALFHRGGREIPYTGEMDAFRAWLSAHCRETTPDAILLFGDRRRIHIDACAVAAELGIKLYAFEEGYLRPDFVTFERGGNNARSPLPRDRAVILTHVTPQRVIRHIKPGFLAMTFDAIAYYIVLSLGRKRFPLYHHHRERTLGGEAKAWWRNTWRRVAATLPDQRRQEALIASHSRRYFVVALQVHDDLQAVHHGRGWTQERLIETSIRSFAEHAPADTQLVFRCHPYDRGHSTHRPLITATARACDVQDRVHFLETGHGPSLLASARGFITVNSTMALSAMYHACPVLALGHSFYKIPGLVASGEDEAGLAAFWREPGIVDQPLYDAFLDVIRSEALLNGSFYRSSEWPAMICEILQRLEEDVAGDSRAVASR